MKTIQQPIQLLPRMKYRGESVIKASDDEVRHLLPLGWSILHRAKVYTYLRPPTTHHGRKVLLSLQVPEFVEIQVLACQLHEARRAWEGEVFGWPAYYRPREAGVYHSRIVSWGQPERLEERSYVNPTRFHIGDTVWSVSSHWDDSDEAAPRWVGEL